MKRALAERAKATPSSTRTKTLTNNECIPASVVSSSTKNNNVKSKSSNNTSTTTLLCASCLSKISEKEVSTTATSSTTTKSRKKFKIENNDDCDSSNNDNKFYLKHQNRALYSEYMSLKEDVTTLDKEKIKRKKEINDALRTLNEIEMLWKRVVFDLYGWLDCILHELAPDSCEQQTLSNSVDSNLTKTTAALSKMKPKFLTKEEIDEDEHEFENTTYLLQILHRFLQTMPSFKQQQQTNLLFNESCNLLYQQMNHFSSLLSPIPSKQEQNQDKITSLQLSLELTQNQMKELKISKDKAMHQCRKIKKWFWRVVTERCTLQHARKVLEDQSYDLDCVLSMQDNDNNDDHDNNMNNAVNNSADQNNITNHSNVAQAINDDDVDDSKNKSQQQKIGELNLKLSCRDEQIKELTEQLQNAAKNDNDRDTNKIPNKKSKEEEEEHIKLKTELSSTKRIIKQQLHTIENLTNQCAIEKANTLHYQKSLDDLQIKHDKKVQDVLLSISPSSLQDHDNQTTTDITKVTELQHKYSQALEEFKQLDSLRYTLKETRKLNDYHQHKMEEYKSKYISSTQTKKEKIKGNADNHNTNDNQNDTSDTTATHNHNNPSNNTKDKVSYDKMKTDFRRVRKELAAANISKENYKSKLEKLDKERETLIKTNTRLLKQNCEKEEVNTESLSTILHLKRVLELKEKEKEQLDVCKKSAEQLALSARMMIKGKERIGDELQLETKKIENEQNTLQEQNDTLQKQNDEHLTRVASLQNTITNHQAKITTIQNQYQTTHEKLIQMQKDKYTLIEKLSISNNSNNKNAITEGSSSSSSTTTSSAATTCKQINNSDYSVDQLTTQVNVLKGRLACPICNYRDKTCILSRCRHMHCRHCIDENIKNRSRKCPTCGQRFDTKDVGDIWL